MILRTRYNLPSLWRVSSCQRPQVAGFASSQTCSSPHQPNAPLDLDPSFRALLKDVNMSLADKSRTPYLVKQQAQTPRQLEIFPDDLDAEQQSPQWVEDEDESRESRKSPAAVFGSHRIGAVVLPKQLQDSVTNLVESSNKSLLHVDAKRLFYEGDGENESQWASSYDVSYKSRKQAYRHLERDGTAFASVALPAHYSAIYSILEHIKHRLGPKWTAQRIIDWGAGTGSGLWASAHAFSKPMSEEDSFPEDLTLDQSLVESYIGIDKREGLVTIAKRLLQNVKHGDMVVSWQKSFQPDDKVPRSKARDVLALSAFSLSSIPAPLSRKAVVKEMWESGAYTIIIIDHNSPLGFQCVAEARQHLLDMGAREVEDPITASWDSRGSHVVAPCPHDGACPLYHPGSNRLICGFEQRLQRPAFVRKTKHSGVGHEDIGYSYVVIQRGIRPNSNPDMEVGRVGQIGKEELEKTNEKQKQKQLEPVAPINLDEVESFDATQTEAESRRDILLKQPDPDSVNKVAAAVKTEAESGIWSQGDIENSLRSESFNWPRLVFPPLKRSGHIILDCCTPEGKIMRLTIPKSQGKQPYYDARKSSWGDIFPHKSKNKTVERYQSMRVNQDSTTDIGKRGVRPGHKHGGISYEKVGADIKDRKKRERWKRLRRRDLLDDDIE